VTHGSGAGLWSGRYNPRKVPIVFTNQEWALPHFKCACLLLTLKEIVLHREIPMKNEANEDGWIAVSPIMY